MRILGVILSLLLLSCSTDVSNGGATSEVPNGIVIIASNGLPAVGATAEVIDGALWQNLIELDSSPVIEELTADEKGLIKPGSTTGYRSVFISHGSKTGIARGSIDTVYLEESVILKGTASGKKIYLSGTPYISDIANDTFLFEKVPASLYSLLIEKEGALIPAQRIAVDQDTTISTTPANRLLFDDFLGGYANNPLNMVSSGVGWYLTSDSIISAYKNDQWISNSAGATGNSNIFALELESTVLCSLYLGDVNSSSYAGIGATLKGSSLDSGFNLSTMSSISMRLRGSGTTSFSLKTKENIDLNISSYHKELTLLETWQNIEIYVDSLILDDEDSSYTNTYPWSTVSNDTRFLQFMWNSRNNSIDSTYWIEIDSIYFNDVTKPF